MRLLTKHEKYALWRVVADKELAEKKSEQEMDRMTIAHLIKDYLKSIEGEEDRLCIKWQKIWKLLKNDV